MKRCRDCSYWHPAYDPNDANALRECLVISSSFMQSTEMARVVDGYGAGSGEPPELHTHPDFGCSLWKEKEPT